MVESCVQSIHVLYYCEKLIFVTLSQIVFFFISQ